MEKLLKFMSGKKSTIASVIWAITAYLAVKWILWEPEVVLIWTLSTVIFGSMSYGTKKMYEKSKK